MESPINEETYVEYYKLNAIFYIKGKVYRIKLKEDSSGLQSIIPLLLVSWYLSDSVQKQSASAKELVTSEQIERFRKRFKEINDIPNLTDELKKITLSELGKRVYQNCHYKYCGRAGIKPVSLIAAGNAKQFYRI